MTKNLLTLITIAFLSSCATTNEVLLAEFTSDAENKMPPITVFYKHAADRFAEDCTTFDQQSLLHHCLLNDIKLRKLQQVLKESSTFESVSYADNDLDYNIQITTATYTHENAEALGSAALAGATLMLAPLKMPAKMKAVVGLYWHGHLLQQFEYTLPYTIKASLLTLGQDFEKDIASSLATHLIKDLQSDDYFSSIFLAKRLQSSLYTSDMTLPNQVSDFTKGLTKQYHNPFMGAQVRYTHPEIADNHIDVFVYPVRNWRWDNIQAVLDEESLAVRKEIEFTEKKGYISALHLNDNSLEHWPVKGENLPIIQFDGSFKDISNKHKATKTYITIVKDKFIKVRHTGLKENTDGTPSNVFVKGLLEGIDIPEESMYMATVREKWRNKRQH